MGVPGKVGMLGGYQFACFGGVSVQPFCGRYVFWRFTGNGLVGCPPVVFAVVFVSGLVTAPKGVVLWKYQPDSLDDETWAMRLKELEWLREQEANKQPEKSRKIRRV
ncbi:MAG: hypothetical protein LBD87_00345 [Prevotellaceae bacterium]|jgi:hypothetical protein|nr:hypothetical protein [Prevotellaceae bacterium]